MIKILKINEDVTNEIENKKLRFEEMEIDKQMVELKRKKELLQALSYVKSFNLDEGRRSLVKMSTPEYIQKSYKTILGLSFFRIEEVENK